MLLVMQPMQLLYSVTSCALRWQRRWLVSSRECLRSYASAFHRCCFSCRIGLTLVHVCCAALCCVTVHCFPAAGLSMDVMDASGSTGNDVSKGKDVMLHKVKPVLLAWG